MNDIAEQAMRRTMANSSKRALDRTLDRLKQQAESQAIATGEPMGAILTKLVNREAERGKAMPDTEPLPPSSPSVTKKDRDRERAITRLRQEATSKAHAEGRPFKEVFEQLKAQYCEHRALD